MYVHVVCVCMQVCLHVCTHSQGEIKAITVFSEIAFFATWWSENASFNTEWIRIANMHRVHNCYHSLKILYRISVVGSGNTTDTTILNKWFS